MQHAPSEFLFRYLLLCFLKQKIQRKMEISKLESPRRETRFADPLSLSLATSKDMFAIIRPKPDRLYLQVVPGSNKTYGFTLCTHED